MSLTEEAVNALKAKIEPRPEGTVTETGLHKLANGVLMARHATDDGTREDVDAALQAEAQQLAQLESMREQAEPAPRKRTRRKSPPAEDSAPETPRLRQITITIPGFGGIPSQYTHVYIGTGIAVLGLTAMSFTPQGPDPKTGAPSTTLELSSNPGTKYVFLGNTFIDKFNIKNLLLVEMPEGDE